MTINCFNYNEAEAALRHHYGYSIRRVRRIMAAIACGLKHPTILHDGSAVTVDSTGRWHRVAGWLN